MYDATRRYKSHLHARAIDSGANALAEGFLFGVAALLIIGETWRSSRSQSKRRDSVDDSLEELRAKVTDMSTRLDTVLRNADERWQEEKQRSAYESLLTQLKR